MIYSSFEAQIIPIKRFLFTRIWIFLYPHFHSPGCYKEEIGPYPVLSRNSKFFTVVLIKNNNVNISIDRLKPAHLLNEEIVNNFGFRSSRY